MLEEHKKDLDLEKTEYININAKMNLVFKIEKNVIYNEINKIFDNYSDIILTKDIEIKINDKKNNIEIFINFKMRNFKDFSKLVKQIILAIEQKIIILTNSKPLNINLVFEGLENEN
ncbi:Uncharacterised protein [Chlamydia abortus]|nr:Uncharacterised protein [Chlamydia abortus]